MTTQIIWWGILYLLGHSLFGARREGVGYIANHVDGPTHDDGAVMNGAPEFVSAKRFAFGLRRRG
jgi:hypothetical protein